LQEQAPAARLETGSGKTQEAVRKRKGGTHAHRNPGKKKKKKKKVHKKRAQWCGGSCVPTEKTKKTQTHRKSKGGGLRACDPPVKKRNYRGEQKNSSKLKKRKSSPKAEQRGDRPIWEIRPSPREKSETREKKTRGAKREEGWLRDPKPRVNPSTDQ